MRSKAYLIVSKPIDGAIDVQIADLKKLLEESGECHDIQSCLLIRRLQAQMMIHHGTSTQQNEGRELIKEVLTEAENNGLATEMRLARAMLKS